MRYGNYENVMMCHYPNQDGFSTISFLLSAGLLIFFVSSTLQGWLNADYTAKIVSSSESAKVFDDVIQASIVPQLADPSTFAIPNPDHLILPSSSSAGLMHLHVTKNVTGGLPSEFVKAINRDPAIKKAAQRCQVQTKISNTTNPASSIMRFCVNMKPNPNAVKSNYAGKSFSEITILLRDSRNGKPISWKNFVESNMGIARIYYTFYYPVTLNSQVIYRSRNGYQTSARLNGGRS